MNDQLQSGIRFFLKFLGGMAIEHGYTTDSGWLKFTGAAMGVIGFTWGMFHRSKPNNTQPPITGAFSALLFAMLMALLTSVAFVGCATRPVVTVNSDGTSVTNFVQGPDVKTISEVAGGAALFGSKYWINSHPNDRSYFVAANESLKVLIDQKNYDPTAFYAAMAGLPIKELKTENGNGTLIITAAIFVFRQGAQHADGVLRQELVAATLSSVQQGIQAALDSTVPHAGRAPYWDRLRQAWERDRGPVIDVEAVVF